MDVPVEADCTVCEGATVPVVVGEGVAGVPEVAGVLDVIVEEGCAVGEVVVVPVGVVGGRVQDASGINVVIAKRGG